MAISKKIPERLIPPYEKQYSPAVDYESPFNANLDMTMPERKTLNTQEDIETTSQTSKPAGMISRIKDFVTGQGQQFIAEQTGMEDKNSSSGIGRVLRSLAAAGAIGLAGGQPAIQAATGIAGTVRSLANQREEERQRKQKEQMAMEDRALSRENIIEQMQERKDLSALRKSNVADANKIRYLKTITEMFRPQSVKTQKSEKPKEEKIVQFPGQSFNTVEGVSIPDAAKTQSDLMKTYVYPLAGKIRSSGAFRNSKDLRLALQDIRNTPELMTVPNEYLPIVREAIVKELFPGEATVPQKVEMLQAANPQTSVMEEAGKNSFQNVANSLKELANYNFDPEIKKLPPHMAQTASRIQNWRR